MTDFFYLDELLEMIHNSGKGFLYNNGITILGDFNSYCNHEDICCAGFLQNPEISTSMAIRFSGVFAQEGTSDTIRDIRAASLRLYTEEGIQDLITHNIDFSDIKLDYIPKMIMSFKEYYRNRLYDESHLWNLVSDNPELLGVMLRFFSDTCTVKSYKNINFFGLNEYELRSDKNVMTKGRFVLRSMEGVKSIDRREAEFYAGFDPGIASRELIDDLKAGKLIEYELAFVKQDGSCLSLGSLCLEEVTAPKYDEKIVFNPLNTVKGICLSRPWDYMTGICFSEADRIYGKAIAF